MIKNKQIIQLALSQFGIKEIQGQKDNPEILKYFNGIGFDGKKLKDETSWCSAFANWIAFQLHLPMSEKLNARSWLKVGEQTATPEQGDIVVFWRESKTSWKGHVAFFVKETKNYIYVLGGNQNNEVNIKPYPKNRLLQYRRITK